MRTLFRHALFALALLSQGAPALAQTPEDEAAVKAVIGDWYARVGRFKADAPWALMAPGGVDAGPGYAEPADLHSGAAVVRGPYINNELAARAMQFRYDIDVLKVDPRFAKAIVWERGYFFAAAAQKTYEMAASTTFLFEKQDNGAWKILLHDAKSIGIPDSKKTEPMPDLRGLYYQRCGAACDPAADAKKATEF